MTLLDQVDPKLRRRYLAGWESYAKLVRTNGPKADRSAAYDKARVVEEEFAAALGALSREQDRIRGRKKMKP